MRRARFGIAIGLAMCAGRPAVAAGVADWRLNEVLTAGPGGDASVRFVELYTAPGACWFPTTHLTVYDASGQATGTVAPFAATTCFGADAYLLLATPAAQAAYGVSAEDGVVPALPRDAGQLCLVSSTTIYDCVRWGAITTPVHDLFGPDDDTAVIAPPGDVAMARVDQLHVVAADWALISPTPRAPNDGTPWIPPDAMPDAAPGAPDAAGPDAAPDAAVDARPPADARIRPDAANQRYLDLDPGGGACACRGGRADAAAPAIAVALLLTRARRRGRRAAASGRSGR